MGYLFGFLRGGHTSAEGDTLECTADHFTAAGSITTAGDIVSTAGNLGAVAITATSAVSDADGDLSRRYIHQFTAQDISAGAATVSGPIMPVAATILRAYYVQTEANAAAMATGAVQLGIADADGTSNADVDKFTLGTTAANGLLVAEAAIGTVVELTLATTAVAAGKMITATHVQQAVAGTVVQIVEYVLDA